MSKKITTPEAEVNWFTEEVRLKIENATQEILTKAAFNVENEARLNIQRQDQIDTSFMINSSYVRTPDTSTFAQTDNSGTYTSYKTGAKVKRERAPEIALNQAGALVAFAAVYAFWQELMQPFLFPALQATERAMDGIIERTAREEGLT